MTTGGCGRVQARPGLFWPRLALAGGSTAVMCAAGTSYVPWLPGCSLGGGGRGARAAAKKSVWLAAMAAPGIAWHGVAWRGIKGFSGVRQGANHTAAPAPRCLHCAGACTGRSTNNQRATGELRVAHVEPGASCRGCGDSAWPLQPRPSLLSVWVTHRRCVGRALPARKGIAGSTCMHA